MLDIRFDNAGCDRWFAIDDRVMGGVSRSGMEYSGHGTGVFRGAVSLDSGGGFASVRLNLSGQSLEGAHGVRLRVRGDGKLYKLSLRGERDFNDVLHQASFVAPADWADVDLPLDSFEPRFRGRPVPDAAPLDVSAIASIGLMISARQAGEFRLEIESIRGYAEADSS